MRVEERCIHSAATMCDPQKRPPHFLQVCTRRPSPRSRAVERVRVRLHRRGVRLAEQQPEVAWGRLASLELAHLLAQSTQHEEEVHGRVAEPAYLQVVLAPQGRAGPTGPLQHQQRGDCGQGVASREGLKALRENAYPFMFYPLPCCAALLTLPMLPCSVRLR